jgi:acylphosphatase
MADSDRPYAAFSAVVNGRVQGVGFRWSAMDAARRLGVVGWVRNAADGSVEVHAEGDPDALERFRAWLKKGPPAARVDSVSVRHLSPSGTFRRFEVEA